MNTTNKPDQSASKYKLVKVFLTIAAVTVLTLQPIAPSYAFGPGPDRGPDPGPDKGPDRGPDPGPDPGPDRGPDKGPDPGPDPGPGR